MKIPIGEMREKISLYESTATETDSGSVQASWSALPALEVYARKRPLTAGEITLAQTRQTMEDVVFELRYNPAIVQTMRIGHNGTYYDIESVRDPDGRKEFVMIYASGGVRAGA